MTGAVAQDLLIEAASRLQALAPAVLAAQTRHDVTAVGGPPPPDLQGRAFQLPLDLSQELPVLLQLWLSDGLLAQLAAAWNHEVPPADICNEMANVLAGQLLTQLAAAGLVGNMGLPCDGGEGAAPRVAEGWWRCHLHWLHLALLPRGES